jgi:hypothetical protein
MMPWGCMANMIGPLTFRPLKEFSTYMAAPPCGDGGRGGEERGAREV